MGEPTGLAGDRHWRMAVWTLRVGGLGLAVALAGLIVLLAGGTPWVLGAGVIVWLVTAAVTVTGVIWARHDLAEPRPGYWPMRFMLIRDAVRARPSTAPRKDPRRLATGTAHLPDHRTADSGPSDGGG